MPLKPNCPVIAIEEHYWDKELAAHAATVERNASITERLFDMGALRIKEMDEAGVDVQVLSHGAPSAQRLTGSDAAEITARVNDRLADFCATNPKRFAAFCALPTIDPVAAANELERCRHQEEFQGRDDPRPLERRVSRRARSTGRSTSARRSSTCRSISIRRCRIRR